MDPSLGATLHDEAGNPVGDVRSAVVRSPRLGAIALAMIRREVEAGTALVARWTEEGAAGDGVQPVSDASTSPFFPSRCSDADGPRDRRDGLVGMHLVPRLQREGWRVRALRETPRAPACSAARRHARHGDVLEATGFCARGARMRRGLPRRGCHAARWMGGVPPPERGRDAERHCGRDERESAARARQQRRRAATTTLRGRWPQDRRVRADRPHPGDVVYARSKASPRRSCSRRSGRVRCGRPRYDPRSFTDRSIDSPSSPARTLRHGFAPVIAGDKHAGHRARGQRRRRMVLVAQHDAANGRAINPRARLRRHGARVLRARRREWAGACGSSPFRWSSRVLVFGVQDARADDRRRPPERRDERVTRLSRARQSSPARSSRVASWAGIRPCTPRGVVDAFRWWAAHH